jgi:Family of unknown function (DUF6353)
MKIDTGNITREIGRNILKMKMNSPHIFFAIGLVGSITSTVLASRATLKLEKTLDEIKSDFQGVKEMHNKIDDDKYNHQEYIRDLGYVYAKSVAKLFQLYGPAVIVGGASIASLTGSHVQLARRNATLTFALAAVTKAYEEYRESVRKEVGEQRELELYHDIHTTEIEAGGKKQTITYSGHGHSIYARFFDETCVNWEKDPEINRMFIQHQETYANHLLRARGHVLLNDVYDALGFERTSAGSIVGWVLNGDGDGYIDFGVYELSSNRFVNGIERSILLDFNVDGVIWQLIGD